MKFFSTFSMTPEKVLLSRALNYGDGVFETFRVVNRQIPLFDYHAKRLKSSLQRLGITPPDTQEIHNRIMALAEDNADCIAKLVVFRKDYHRGYSSQSKECDYFITINPISSFRLCDQLTVSSVKLSRSKTLAGIKHLNRLEQVIAANELNSSDYSDAILTDGKNIIETTYKNIVLIKNNKIYSPKLNNSGVHGVALSWLEDWCVENSIEFKWKKIKLSELSDYQAMMTCNSIQGFSLIKNVDNQVQFSHKSPIADKIKSSWSQLFKF
ncbi:MAG: aminodeoxychorismate lyase [Gammaproteobacteria bacterium]|nr:aminodeoxychorismate lyase [Xanthomonadales bacterium]